MDEQKENKQINWFTAITLIAGTPLYVLIWKDHEWAEIALKVYLCTAIVFGSLLLFLERKSLKEKWLWIGRHEITDPYTAPPSYASADDIIDIAGVDIASRIPFILILKISKGGLRNVIAWEGIIWAL